MLRSILALTCLAHTGHGQWNGQPRPGEEAACVADHMKARMEDPTFKTRMVNWNVEEAANRLAEDMRAVMADPELKKNASRFAERTEALMANPKVREQAMRIVESITAKMADPVLHEEARRIAANVEEMERMMQKDGPVKSLAMKFLSPGFKPVAVKPPRAQFKNLFAQKEETMEVVDVASQVDVDRGTMEEMKVAADQARMEVSGQKEAQETKDGEEELSEGKKLMQKVKDAGVAGIISYTFWEFAFWGASIPVCISAYYGVTGHWPDFSNPDDQKQLSGEAFAFVNVARFAVPARIGLALGTVPWIKENIVEKFGLEKDEGKKEKDENIIE